MNKKIKKITIIALFSAFLCIIAPISLPVNIIPITFATLGLYLIASLMPPYASLIIVIIYLVIGLVGLPVFSSYQGGISVITNVTGGYLIGYLPCVFITCLIIKINKAKFYLYPLGMIIGTICCYIFGSIWFLLYTKTSIGYTLAVCVLPFLLGDIIKIIFASIIGYLLNKNPNIQKILDDIY